MCSLCQCWELSSLWSQKDQAKHKLERDRISSWSRSCPRTAFSSLALVTLALFSRVLLRFRLLFLYNEGNESREVKWRGLDWRAWEGMIWLQDAISSEFPFWSLLSITRVLRQSCTPTQTANLMLSITHKCGHIGPDVGGWAIEPSLLFQYSSPMGSFSFLLTQNTGERKRWLMLTY